MNEPVTDISIARAIRDNPDLPEEFVRDCILGNGDTVKPYARRTVRDGAYKKSGRMYLSTVLTPL